ncbi:MAG: RluA family pseudouridine synthase [Clostridia bacterium]|nr:RluA family pseudouridine synthase [Clostridia bacterium]
MIFTAGEDCRGMRLDVFLASAAQISRSAAEKHITAGLALLNGKPATKKSVVNAGDEISYNEPEPVECKAVAQDIPLDVVYEDGDMIVINKPVGMVVHPAAGNPDGTLVNALLAHCGNSLSGVGGELRPGIVHRIDKDTSGLIAVAKNDAAHIALSAQLKDKTMSRVYFAIVRGNIKDENGRIDKPIGRSLKDRKKMAIVPDGREAATRYYVVERYEGWTLLRLELETGRTHQIRVHMASVGHSLMGDAVYSSANSPFENKHKALIPGQMLHAAELRLVHPKTGENMSFSAELPDNFKRVIEILRGSANNK